MNKAKKQWLKKLTDNVIDIYMPHINKIAQWMYSRHLKIRVMSLTLNSQDY